MTVQVFGANGMLGRAVLKKLQQFSIYSFACDERLEEVTRDSICGDIIINCAGLIKQRNVLSSEFMISNAYGPHILAEACDAVGSRLVHISTDCVFSRFGPHSEDSLPTPDDPYSRSKLAGEITRKPHITIRTSFIGCGGTGLVADIMRGPVRASENLLWSGHTVDTVAGVIVNICKRPSITGLLHIPGEFQSRLGLCLRIARHFNLPEERVIKDNLFIADRRLISSKWADLNFPPLPSFYDQMEAL